MGSMKTKAELLATVQSNFPTLDIARIRDIVEEIEFEGGGDLASRISMQKTAEGWGISVSEVYRLINPLCK